MTAGEWTNSDLWLFAGLPVWAQVLFSVTLTLIVIVQTWNVFLYQRSRHNEDDLARRCDGRPPGEVEADFLWVFVVPALNEERTLADSVARLIAMDCTHRRIHVIDDGSDDHTPEVLAELQRAHPELGVLRRELPNARLGKADALNEVYTVIDDAVRTGAWGDWSAEQVIVVVVDADGRLSPNAAKCVGVRMSDPAVGGVQVKVRIYNRDHPLTWCQDVEFSIYGLLYQAGRSTEGIAGMGGNGQFNRLSALRSIDEGNGPWHPTLTEDQDLGIRLLLNGWRSEHDNSCDVSQQGVRNIKRLWTQRTRWSQGNLQAMTYLGRVARGPLRWWRCCDLLGVLVLPIVQGIVGVSLACSIWFAVVERYRVVPASPVLIAAFLVLGMGSTVIGCVARCGGSWRGVLRSVPVAVAYVGYTWMMWPVLIRSSLRVLLRRGSWAKTEREIVPDEGEAADAAAVSRHA